MTQETLIKQIESRGNLRNVILGTSLDGRDTLHFTSNVNLDTGSAGRVILQGEHRSEMELFRNENGTPTMIEWDMPTLEDTEHIGLEFDGDMLTGYDGVFELSDETLDWIAYLGYRIDPDLWSVPPLPVEPSPAGNVMEAKAGDKGESEEGQSARLESTGTEYHASDYYKVAADYEHVRGVVVGIIGGAYADADEANSELGIEGIIVESDIEGMPWGRDQHDGVWVGIGVRCIQERLEGRAVYLEGVETRMKAVGVHELFHEPQGKTFTLKPGQHLEDVYIFYPRERDTIIAALRLWQDRDKRTQQVEDLMDVATNNNVQDALDENEIDILIEDKLISALDAKVDVQSTGAGESGEAPAPLDPEDAEPTGDGLSRMFYKADAIGITFRFDIPTHMIPESYDMLTYRLDDGLVHFWGPRGGHIAEIVPLRLTVEHMGAIEQDDLAIPRSLTRDCKVCGKRHPKNSTGCSTYPASWDTVACAGGCGSQVPIGSEAVDAKYCSDCYNKGVRA